MSDAPIPPPAREILAKWDAERGQSWRRVERPAKDQALINALASENRG